MSQAVNLGRAWSLRVSSSSDANSGDVITYSTDTWEPEALRISFTVTQQPRAMWQADITIYNLATASEQQALQAGCMVELYGGYQNGQNYGLIFRGVVYQPLWERVDGTDYAVTLRCFAGYGQLYSNFIKLSMSAGTQGDFVRAMASSAHTPFTTSLIDLDTLHQKTLPRGKVAFGAVSDYFGQIGNDQNMMFFPTGDTVALGAIAKGDTPADVTYAPPIPLGSSATALPGVNYTLLGVPQQTEAGVEFTVELDSRLIVRRNPWIVVALNMSQINQFALSPGQIVAPFSQSGEYVVVGVRHIGDSRGDAWVSEVTAATQGGLLAAIVQANK